jgi:transcriptional regulator with XRE-family HTH domain
MCAYFKVCAILRSMTEAPRAAPSDDDLVRAGALIERARAAAGLSARQLASAAGISAAYLRAIERGVNPKTKRPSRPSAGTVLALCRELGMPTDQLFELIGYDQHAAFAESDKPTGEAEVRHIQNALRGVDRRGPFLRDRAMERLERFAADFRMIADGVLRGSPEEEKFLTRLAILQCGSHLRAVSFGDEQRWPSDTHGDIYLQLHEQLRQRNVEMTRIFLLNPAAIPALVPVFRRHLTLGIDTFILDPALINDYYWRDMVIYDDALMRTAAAHGSDPDRKTVEFTDDAGRIAQGLSDFRDVLRIARASLASAEQVLARGGHLDKP